MTASITTSEQLLCVPRIFLLEPRRAYPGTVKFFFRSARPAPRSYYQPTMAYRMRMFMSQKPSSVDLRDLRVSDFKRVPGFNYVSAEDEHTDNSLCALTSERRGPSTRQTACKSTRFPRDRRTSPRRLSTRCPHVRLVIRGLMTEKRKHLGIDAGKRAKRNFQP